MFSDTISYPRFSSSSARFASWPRISYLTSASVELPGMRGLGAGRIGLLALTACRVRKSHSWREDTACQRLKPRNGPQNEKPGQLLPADRVGPHGDCGLRDRNNGWKPSVHRSSSLQPARHSSRAWLRSQRVHLRDFRQPGCSFIPEDSPALRLNNKAVHVFPSASGHPVAERPPVRSGHLIA